MSRFDLSEEDFGTGRKRFRATDAHGPAKRKGEPAHDHLQRSDVEGDAGQAADEDDGRRDDECEDEFAARQLIAEHERQSVFGTVEKSLNALPEAVESVAHEGHVQDEKREHQLDADAHNRQPPVDGAPVVGEGVRESEEHGDAQKAY
jgi:hypothetical protein